MHGKGVQAHRGSWPNGHTNLLTRREGDMMMHGSDGALLCVGDGCITDEPTHEKERKLEACFGIKR